MALVVPINSLGIQARYRPKLKLLLSKSFKFKRHRLEHDPVDRLFSHLFGDDSADCFGDQTQYVPAGTPSSSLFHVIIVIAVQQEMAIEDRKRRRRFLRIFLETDKLELELFAIQYVIVFRISADFSGDVNESVIKGVAVEARTKRHFRAVVLHLKRRENG
ncbi:hypothetical protein CCACVL1_25041 [Corchorus capsularis]|uniref:Uncharacterized protein n=1 Tax=Corchorus capsularis TaxID=210143 RepID=A0A1R3GM74_COCAP|nr:hypothetical protein CCACVL1_25041 [Corchorus capsularis]